MYFQGHLTTVSRSLDNRFKVIWRGFKDNNVFSKECHFHVPNFLSVWLECSPMETWFNPRSCHTKDSKNGTALLNTKQYKVRIKGKVEQSRERSSAFPCISV